MATLVTKIKLYCEANGKTVDFKPYSGNVDVRDDGSGSYIRSWSVDGLNKPTDSQLSSYETSGNTLEKNETIRATRRLAYGDIGEQLDEIYKDIDAWKARIKKIKDDNPKE
jgi:hypothetical protein|tara:strand:- start:36 stop:368 length:333 start_codon:yes stop_codon:yes gene_type:complete